MNSLNVIHILNNILLNNTSFLGASGHISFDKNGDRKNGLFGFYNALKNGTVQSIGYYQQLNKNTKNITAIIDINSIKWPSDFQKYNMIPRSNILIINKIHTINNISLLYLQFYIQYQYY